MEHSYIRVKQLFLCCASMADQIYKIYRAACKEIENLCYICIEVLGSLICSLDEGNGQQIIIFSK